MSRRIGWYYPVDASDQWDGFNEPGIETFAGSPIQNLAREVNQNALDAASDGCVQVTMRLNKVETASIPDIEELRATIQACHEASRDESQKAEVFFREAREELKKPEIDVLEVSDFNTHGMQGPCENGTPYFAFMKAKGQSRKDSSTASGSYGIGKFAPYAVSKFRTIFVSTIFQDTNNSYQMYTQGKSILMSHDRDGHRHDGGGFWGAKARCRPAVGLVQNLPSWLARVSSADELANNKGTKLSILCFDVSDNWREYLAVSVAENFFGAIESGRLSVDIDGIYKLDKDYIAEFLSDPHIREIIEDQPEEPDQFDTSCDYLSALQEKGDVTEVDSQMRALGHVQMRILVQPGLRKRVCVLRNGMFISDSLDRLKSFSDLKEFVAVVRCLSPEGNELLRAMEPPRHNDFEPERLPTKKEQKAGARALKDLAQWVRDMLKLHAKDPVSEVTTIDELKEFFSEEGEDGSGDGTEDINPYGEVIIHAKPIKMKIYSASRNVDTAGDGDGDTQDGGGGGSGSGGGDGRGGRGNGTGGTSGGSSRSIVELRNVRTVVSKGAKRRIAFTPDKASSILIRVMEAGADSDYNTSIVVSDAGLIKGGVVQLEVEAGARYTLNIELSDDYTGAVKVVAYEV